MKTKGNFRSGMPLQRRMMMHFGFIALFIAVSVLSTSVVWAGKKHSLDLIPGNCTAYGGINLEKLFSLKIVTDNVGEIEEEFKTDNPLLEADVSGNSDAAALQKELKEKGPVGFSKSWLKRVYFGIDAANAVQTGPDSESPPLLFVLETQKPLKNELDSFLVLTGEKFVQKILSGGIKGYVEEGNEQEFMVANIDTNHIALGNPGMIESAAKLKIGSDVKPVTANKELMTLSEGSRNNLIWLAWKVGEAEKNMMTQNKPEEVAVNPNDINGVLLTFDSDKQMRLSINLDVSMTTQEKAVEAKNSMVNLLKPTAMMFLGINDQDFIGAVDGNVARLTMTMSEQQIEALKAKLEPAEPTDYEEEPPPEPEPGTRKQTQPPVEGAGTISGNVMGKPFNADALTFSNGVLTLSNDNGDSMMIFTFLKDNEIVPGKKIEVTSPGGSNPHIHIKYAPPGSQMLTTKTYVDGYTMILTFDSVDPAFVTGSIQLSIPDADSTFISGDFKAEKK